MKADIDKELEKLLQSHKTVIKVFGAGGAGNNTISRLLDSGTANVETFAINTDAQDLLHATAHQKILIGRDMTSGLGAGSDPKIGEESAIENEKELKDFMVDADLVFVTCGLGGGTGSGSAPVVAALAREVGALTISIVTMPFSEEGVMRWTNAQYGLERLKKNSDTLIVIENDRLLELDPEVSLDEAFHVADGILVNAVRGITDLVTQKGLVNLDFADIRTIMRDGGTALIGMAESDSPDRAVEAVEQAIENPLIDLKIDGAKSALLNICGGKDMTIKDAKTAMHTLAKKLDHSARIIWGARINPELDNKVSVMILATGLKENLARRPVVDDPGINSTVGAVIQPPAMDPYPQEEPVSEEPPSPSLPELHAEPEEPADKKKEAKKIFCEIMEEESDADLKIFSDALTKLQDKKTGRDHWEDLRQASSSLAGTAHMFDFEDIAKLMNAAEDLIAAIIHKDFFYGAVVDLFVDIPTNLRAMIKDDGEAREWSEGFVALVNQLAMAIKDGSIDTEEAFVKHRDAAMQATDDASTGVQEEIKVEEFSEEFLDEEESDDS